MVKLTIEADTKQDLLRFLTELRHKIEAGFTSGYTGSVAWDLEGYADECEMCHTSFDEVDRGEDDKSICLLCEEEVIMREEAEKRKVV